MKLAAGAGIDPDRISFLKVLKHVRRSVIVATVTTATNWMSQRGRQRARRLAGCSCVTCQQRGPLGKCALAQGLCQWEDAIVGDDRDTELPDILAEAGRRVGQAVTDGLERIRPAFDAVAEVAHRPEVRAVIERAEQVMRRMP